jgi:hypothetical protein
MDVLVLLRAWREELERNALWLTKARTSARDSKKGTGKASLIRAGVTIQQMEPQWVSDSAELYPLAFEGRACWQARDSGGARFALGAAHPATSAVRREREKAPSSLAAGSERWTGLTACRDTRHVAAWSTCEPVSLSAFAWRQRLVSANGLEGYACKTEAYKGPLALECNRVPLSRQLLDAVYERVEAVSLSEVQRSQRMRIHLYFDEFPELLWRMMDDVSNRCDNGDDNVVHRGISACGGTVQNGHASRCRAADACGRSRGSCPSASLISSKSLGPLNEGSAMISNGAGQHSMNVLEQQSAEHRRCKRELDSDPLLLSRTGGSISQKKTNGHWEGSVQEEAHSGRCREKLWNGFKDSEAAPPPDKIRGFESDVEATKPPEVRLGSWKGSREPPDPSLLNNACLQEIFGMRYLFIDAGTTDLTRYVLLLPLLARVFAVSCPGIRCIVHFPLEQTHPSVALESKLEPCENLVDRLGSIAARLQDDPWQSAEALKESDAQGAQIQQQPARVDEILDGELCIDNPDTSPVSNPSHPPDDMGEMERLRLVSLLACIWQLFVLPVPLSPSAHGAHTALSLSEVIPYSWRVSSHQQGLLLSGSQADSEVREPPRQLPSSLWRRISRALAPNSKKATQTAMLSEELESASTQKPSKTPIDANADARSIESGRDQLSFYIAYDNGSSVDMVTCKDPIVHAVRTSRGCGGQPVMVLCFNQRYASTELLMLMPSQGQSNSIRTAQYENAQERTEAESIVSLQRDKCCHENIFVVDIGTPINDVSGNEPGRESASAAAFPHKFLSQEATSEKISGTTSFASIEQKTTKTLAVSRDESPWLEDKQQPLTTASVQYSRASSLIYEQTGSKEGRDDQFASGASRMKQKKVDLPAHNVEQSLVGSKTESSGAAIEQTAAKDVGAEKALALSRPLQKRQALSTDSDAKPYKGCVYISPSGAADALDALCRMRRS